MQTYNNQRGAVLIITLVFLVILTIVVLSSNSGSILQEKMTLAVKDSSIALERAEEGLREAEEFIKTTSMTDIEAKAFYFEPSLAPDPFSTATWKDTTKTPASAAGGNAAYFIEKIGPFYTAGGPASNTQVQLGDVSTELVPQSRTGYRIVSRGTVKAGNQVQAQRILVSYFAK